MKNIILRPDLGPWFSGILTFLVLFISTSCTTLKREPNSIANTYDLGLSSFTAPEEDNAEPCEHTPTSFHCVSVVEIYDGDTIFIDLPDQHPIFGKRMGVRIFGIDTPEIRTKDLCEKAQGYKAKLIVEELITNAQRVDIVDVSKDKYFRILGQVLVDGESIAQILLEKNLAYPYFGEKKQTRNWCEVEE